MLNIIDNMVSKISDVMTTHVVTMQKGNSIMAAVNLMADRSISCVIVVDSDSRPIGIMTERDMVKRVLKNVIDPRITKIDEVMTAPVITISADMKITEAINMMHKYHFRRVVVVTDKNRLMGVLTQSDLLTEVHKVQLELEKMNENLRNSVNSLKRYKKSAGTEATMKILKDKIRKLEKSLEAAQYKNANK